MLSWRFIQLNDVFDASDVIFTSLSENLFPENVLPSNHVYFLAKLSSRQASCKRKEISLTNNLNNLNKT
jgi:hypothetical protein